MQRKIQFDLSNIRIVNIEDSREASKEAVKLIRNGEADILMKGLVSTGVLLKCVLDKECGLRKGATLSHVAVFETPFYHKLLGVTDAAMNVAPDLEQKLRSLKTQLRLSII